MDGVVVYQIRWEIAAVGGGGEARRIDGRVRHGVAAVSKLKKLKSVCRRTRGQGEGVCKGVGVGLGVDSGMNATIGVDRL